MERAGTTVQDFSTGPEMLVQKSNQQRRMKRDVMMLILLLNSFISSVILNEATVCK
jgi:hypothetical protein